MKLVKLFFSLLFIITFFSCSNDEVEEVTTSDSPIVGTWNLVEVFYKATVDNDHGIITYVGGATEPRGNIIFYNNYNVSGNSAFTLNSNIMLAGNQPYTLSNPNQKIINADGTWSINTQEYHQLILDIDGEDPATFGYVLHTEDELTMNTTLHEIADGQAVTIDLTVVYNRE